MTKTSRSTVLPSPASSVDPPLRRPRRRPPAAVSLATATLCALSTSSAAHAAGGTAHVVAGQLARDQLQDAELKALLKKHEGAYLHGTLYPDAILLLLQQAEKLSGETLKTTPDDWSHGIKQSAADPPKGMMTHYWQEFWKKCPDGATTDECGVALAFFMGIVTHLVTDGPWHNEFIDRSADLCEAPLTPLDGDGWAHPGGPDVARDPGGEVNSWMRHLVADKDFDGCLSAALRGWPNLLGDVKGVMPRNPQIFAPAKFLNKVATLKTAKAEFRRNLALTCALTEFANAGDTKNCYSCPSGFTHDLTKNVDETGVCTRSWKDETTGIKKGDVTWNGCPSGTWLGYTSCYSCPDGYSHNGWLTADTKGVCYQDNVDNRKATLVKTLSKECPAGEFPNAEFSGCYACPAGYEHNPTLAVGQDGVCIEVRVKTCDSGFFDPRQGGECWSCPAGYSRTVTPAVAVDTEQACNRLGILACKGVTPPAGNLRGTPGALPESMLPFTLLKSAYDADGLTWKPFEANFSMLDWTEVAKKAIAKSKITSVTVKVEAGFPAQGHKALIDNYPGIFAQRDQVAPELFAEPQSAVCSPMISGAITRKGGLNDSAAASARFMDAIWKERKSKAAATVIRIDDYEYAIIKDKQVLYRSTARSCETSRECGSNWPSVCVDGECHRSEMKPAEAGMDRLYYMFVNKASGLCLDPKSYDGGSGRNVGMFRCEGRFDQVFQMTRRTTGPYGRLLTANGNACLDVKGYDGAADKNVGLYACEELDDQAWNIADAGDARWRSSEDGATGWVRVKNLMQGTCLASEGNAESGANVRVEACVPNKATQLWVPIEVNTRGQESHVLVHKGLGGCLDPDGAEAASSSDVAIRRCNGSEDQLFLLGEGDAIARNQRSNICLDVKGNDGAVGRTIGLYTCDGGADQKWSAAPKTDGWKQVKNPKASTCLDVVKKNVQLGKCDVSDASQQWATVPIPTWPG